jgi:alpha-beta hydrolase superfamily lysophospholipase
MLHARVVTRAPACRRRALALLAAGLMLPACAGVGPVTGDPATVLAASSELQAARSTAAVQTYRAADGRELACLVYRGPEVPTDTAVVMLHDQDGHAGTLALIAARLSAAGHHVYTPDRRGAGLNRENRGFVSGDAASADELTSDLDRLLAGMAPHYGRMVLVGFGWGGKLALAYALAHPGRLDDLVLIAPDLEPAPLTPPMSGLRLVGAARPAPASAVELPGWIELATADRAWRAYLAQDPLRLRRVTARFVMASRELDRRVAAAAAARTTPTLLLLAGRDRLVDNSAARDLLGRGPVGTLTVAELPGQAHALPLELPGDLAIAIRLWLESFQEASLAAMPR